jgi:hypothetical protein
VRLGPFGHPEQPRAVPPVYPRTRSAAGALKPRDGLLFDQWTKRRLRRCLVWRVGPSTWSARLGWWFVAVDGFAVWADDLAGAVGMDDEFPAQFVQHDMVMPEAITLQVHQAGRAAVRAADHMMGFTRRGRLITAPRLRIVY